MSTSYYEYSLVIQTFGLSTTMSQRCRTREVAGCCDWLRTPSGEQESMYDEDTRSGRTSRGRQKVWRLGITLAAVSAGDFPTAGRNRIASNGNSRSGAPPRSLTRP